MDPGAAPARRWRRERHRRSRRAPGPGKEARPRSEPSPPLGLAVSEQDETDQHEADAPRPPGDIALAAGQADLEPAAPRTRDAEQRERCVRPLDQQLGAD